MNQALTFANIQVMMAKEEIRIVKVQNRNRDKAIKLLELELEETYCELDSLASLEIEAHEGLICLSCP
jgi:hypothetical protein